MRLPVLTRQARKCQAVDYLDKALGYSPLSGKLLLEAATLAMEMGNTTKAAYYMQRYGQTGRASAPESLAATRTG